MDTLNNIRELSQRVKIDHICLHVKNGNFINILNLFIALLGNEHTGIKTEGEEKWTFIPLENGQRIQLIEWKDIGFGTNPHGARHLCLNIKNPKAVAQLMEVYGLEIGAEVNVEQWDDKWFIHFDCLCTGIELY